jgi:hypothetical protein
MRALSPSELLAVWERGAGETAAGRALLLLGAACGEGGEDPAQLSVGERDRRLLTLREWTFGPELAAVAACPDCGGAQELQFRVADVRVEDAAAGTRPPLELAVAGYQVRFRLPNSLDLRALESGDGNLLGSCVLEATHEGELVSADGLPQVVVAAISERMSEADPQAEVELSLDCPECHRGWTEVFDIGAFFWNEIQAWAIRQLREVHHLAGAYGWSEAQILALSPFRRSVYLNLIAE